MIEPWQVMWGLAALIFFASKWVTWHDAGAPLSRRGFGYLLAWPGLDARTFMDSGQIADHPSWGEWAFAASMSCLGLLIFYGVARIIPIDRPYPVGWAGMIGIVFILHFGIFHLLSCAWRAGGVVAEPLMNWPILSTGLGDFWGKRWNTAFRNLTHRFLFRPLLRRLGSRRMAVAILASFLFSGLVHDVVISLPAGGGYGGPTLFFLLQSAGLLMEPRLRRRGLVSGWRGRLYAAAFLVPPAVLLFHGPFVRNVIVPFMRVAGAIG
jgi:hypothetical protein